MTKRFDSPLASVRLAVFCLTKWPSISVYPQLLVDSVPNNFDCSILFASRPSYCFLVRCLEVVFQGSPIHFHSFKFERFNSILVISSFSLFSPFLAAIAKMLGWKVLYYLHDFKAHPGFWLKSMITDIFNYITCLFSDRIIVFSSAAVSYFAGSMFASRIRPTTLVSISDDYFLHSASVTPDHSISPSIESFAASSAPRFLVFGRSASYKRHRLIQLHYLRSKAKSTLCFLGSGVSALASCCNYSTDSSVSRLLLIDVNYSISDLLSLSRHADAVIICHSEMTQSGVFVDAMCLGLDILSLKYDALSSYESYPGLHLFESESDLFHFAFERYGGMPYGRRLSNKEFYANKLSPRSVGLSLLSFINELC